MHKNIYRRKVCYKVFVAIFVILISIFEINFAEATDQKITLRATENSNHLDLFYVAIKDGVPKLLLKEDLTGKSVVRDPNNTVVEISSKTYTSIPKGFPGTPKGYYLPQSGNDKNALWPGWDTLDIKHHGYGKTIFTFDNVQGDGDIHIYKSTVDKPVIPVLDTNNTKITKGAKIIQPFPTHTHVSWTFTKAGIYKFTLSAQVEKNGVNHFAGKKTYIIKVLENSSENNNMQQDPGKAGKCKAGYEKKQAKNGKIYCVAQINTKPEQKIAKGKICRPVKETRHANPGDTISTTDTIFFSVGSGGGHTHGHFDLGSTVSGGQYVAVIKNDSQAWELASGQRFSLTDAAKVGLPAGLETLGARGATAWMIDQTQKPSVPWLGVNTQHYDLLQNTTGQVTFSMTYSGPGRIAIVQGSSFGKLGNILLGAGGASTWTVPANTHTHPNWFFSAPGQYAVNITQTTVATQPVNWIKNTGRDEFGNECTIASMSQSAGQKATGKFKNNKHEKNKKNKALKKLKDKEIEQEIQMKKNANIMYYAMATVGLLAMITGISVITYSYKKMK